MLHDQEGFVRLPNERLIYTSPPRTSFSLTPPSGYKGPESISVQSSAGCIYLTNQRVSHFCRMGYALLSSTNQTLMNRLSTSLPNKPTTSNPSRRPS